jgi:hypothetical protein
MFFFVGRSKEAEQARVDKELANIRKNFTSNKVTRGALPPFSG